MSSDLSIHHVLDWDYGVEGDDKLRAMLDAGADPNGRAGALEETPLHVSARRRRVTAAEILLDYGAEINAQTAGGKTAYAHAARRLFDDVVSLLEKRGASTQLNTADMFAIAIADGRFGHARQMLEANPGIARTGNPEEDRLLSDVAGRSDPAAVEFLIRSGADIAAPGLDSGTPLHQAAWFGQPANALLLIDAGAPLDHIDETHHGSPLGWAVHGSRFSGGADERQQVYVAVVRLLVKAGSPLDHPAEKEAGSYLAQLLTEASPAVAAALRQAVGDKR